MGWMEGFAREMDRGIHTCIGTESQQIDTATDTEIVRGMDRGMDGGMDREIVGEWTGGIHEGM